MTVHRQTNPLASRASDHSEADDATPQEPPRLLFVDDDPVLLRLLRRQLDMRRSQWTTKFVNTGPEALQELARDRYDVLVSDLDMPTQSGISVLAEARKAFPDTARIMLSGSHEVDVVIEAVPVAHRFLSKPWSADELVDVLDRTLELRRLLTPALRGVAGGISALPSVPAIYHKFVQAVEKPGSSLVDVVRVVEQDAAICARVLQVVNSAFFFPAQQISNVGDAIRYLGLGLLKHLILVSEVFRLFEERNCAPSFSITMQQRHSLLTARLAVLIADKDREQDAFSAGLLHDVGTLLFAIEMAPEWEVALQLSKDKGCPLYQVEEDSFGVSHGELGAYLMGIWGLPSLFVEAAAYHHVPGRSAREGFGMAGVIHVANALAGELDGAPEELDMDYLEQVGLAHRLPDWRKRAKALIAKERK